MTVVVGKSEFTPLNLPKVATDNLLQQLQKGIPNMERRRAWSDTGNQPGIRSLLGEKQAKRLEDIVTKGSSTVLEIGGGHLEASKELAKINLTNIIFTVEPFVEESDLLGLPHNMTVLAKGIEEVTMNDIPDGSVDVVFSGGHTWNYIQDKLGCLQRIWQMLKPGGFGNIEFIGQPIIPSMQQIIDKFQLQDLIHLEKTGGSQVIVIEKLETRQINFGKYICSPSLSGNLPGDVNSYYEFQ